MVVGATENWGLESSGTQSPVGVRTSAHAVRLAPVQVPASQGSIVESPSSARRTPTTTRESNPKYRPSRAAAVANCSSSPTAATSSSSGAFSPARVCWSSRSVKSSSTRAVEWPA